MRRLRRIILNLLTALSALFFVAAISLWIFGYWRTLDFGIEKNAGDAGHDYWHFLNITSGKGSFVFAARWSKLFITEFDAIEREQGKVIATQITTHCTLHSDWDAPPAADHSAWGFGYSYAHEQNGPDEPVQGFVFGSLGAITLYFVEIQLPLWFLVLAAAVLPAIRVSWLRSIPPPGYCARCGYDMRATPDLCPECGAKPTRSAPTGRKRQKGLRVPAVLKNPPALVAMVFAALLIALIWLRCWSAYHPFTYSRDSDSGDQKHDYEAHLQIHLEDGLVTVLDSWQTAPVRVTELDDRPAEGTHPVATDFVRDDRYGWIFPMDHHFLSFGYTFHRINHGYPDVPIDDRYIFEPTQPPTYATTIQFYFPIWSLVVLAAFSATLAVRKWMTIVTRKRKDVCSVCGYDLRATPNQCPECGTAAPTKTST